MATPAQRKREAIELPECGEPAFIQSPKLSEKAAIAKAIQDMEGWQVGLRVLAESVVRESGDAIWSQDDWDVFSGADSVRFNELVSKALDVYGMNGAEKKEVGETPNSPSDSSSAEH